MKKKTAQIYRYILLLQTLLVILVFINMIVNFKEEVKTSFNYSYKQIQRDIDDAVNVLSSLNYSFSSHLEPEQGANDTDSKFSELSNDGKQCSWAPIEKPIQSAFKASNEKVLALDYGVKGVGDVCQNTSPFYADLLDKSKLASTLTILMFVKDYITAAFYVSPHNYIVFSPRNSQVPITQETFDLLKSRPFWKDNLNGEGDAYLYGPTTDNAPGDPLLVVATPLYDEDVFQGVIAMHLSVDKLISDNVQFSQRVVIGRGAEADLPAWAWAPKPIYINNVKTNQMIYLDWRLNERAHYFMQEKGFYSFSLIVAYILLLTMVLFHKAKTEKQFFEKLSQRDPLTNLLNRRGFEFAYKHKETDHAYIGFGVLDVDDFKKVNDTLGHDEGDRVIEFLASSLRRYTRQSDIIARIGGEEFLIYVSCASEQSIVNVFERIRMGTQASAKEQHDRDLTLSIGLCIAAKETDEDLTDLVKKADECLYQAKHNGKNQTVYVSE